MRPLDLPLALSASGRPVTLTYVKVKNVPGALAKVLCELGKMRVNVLNSVSMAEPGCREAYVLAFLDLSEAGLGVDELARRLKELDVVVEVSYGEPARGGLLVNTLTFPMRLIGFRVLAFRVEWISSLFHGVKAVWDERVASTLLFHLGYQGGSDMVEHVRRLTGLNGRSLLEAVLALQQAMGWGIVHLVSYHAKTGSAVVRVEDLFECAPLRGKARRPQSQFYRGVLSGILSHISGRRVTATEVACVAKGDPYCEFTASPV